MSGLLSPGGPTQKCKHTQQIHAIEKKFRARASKLQRHNQTHLLNLERSLAQLNIALLNAKIKKVDLQRLGASAHSMQKHDADMNVLVKLVQDASQHVASARREAAAMKDRQMRATELRKVLELCCCTFRGPHFELFSYQEFIQERFSAIVSFEASSTGQLLARWLKLIERHEIEPSLVLKFVDHYSTLIASKFDLQQYVSRRQLSSARLILPHVRDRLFRAHEEPLASQDREFRGQQRWMRALPPRDMMGDSIPSLEWLESSPHGRALSTSSVLKSKWYEENGTVLADPFLGDTFSLAVAALSDVS